MDNKKLLVALSSLFMEVFTEYIYRQVKTMNERENERKTIIKDTEPIRKEVEKKDSFLMDCYTSDIMDAYNESRNDWD